MRQRIFGALILLTIAAILSFQNCARVTLVPVPTVLSSKPIPPFAIDICSEDIGSELFHFKTAIVTNLNVQPYHGGLYPDSDGDGLRDSAEIEPYLVDNRTSQNFTLDFLCERGNATCGAPCVDSPYNFPGVSLCDFAQFSGNLDPSKVDVDGDGLPTFFEIFRGGYPANSDDTLPAGERDSDADGATVNEELLGMTDPFWKDSSEALSRFHPTSEEVESADCAFPKKLYHIGIPSLPRLDVAAYTDTKTDFATGNIPFSLSHGKDENIYLVMLEMRGLNSSRFLIHRFTMSPNAQAPKNLKNEDFVPLEP